LGPLALRRIGPDDWHEKDMSEPILLLVEKVEWHAGPGNGLFSTGLFGGRGVLKKGGEIVEGIQGAKNSILKSGGPSPGRNVTFEKTGRTVRSHVWGEKKL